MMNLLEAKTIAGSLSSPGKMPCQSYSIPAAACRMGSRLAEIEGSVCSDCYAMKGNYRFGNVKTAQQKRMESLSDPLWVDAMVAQILHTERSGFFRWHDAGDLQSVEHLKQIVEVCKRTPEVLHWLPTREYSTVSSYLRLHGRIPENLVIRLAAYMVDDDPPSLIARTLGVLTSTVTNGEPTCPARNQGNKCLDCRQCWDRSISNISYPKH